MKKRKFKTIFVILLFALNCPLKAGFFNEHARGWHWYENNIDEKKKGNIKKMTEKDAIKYVDNYSKALESARKLAWAQPSYENLKRYLIKQKDLYEKTTVFSNIWKKVLMYEPGIGYELEFPTDHTGRFIYEAKKNEKNTQVLKSLSKTHGLFYFFSSKCPYCSKMSPIVKSFAEKYGWSLIPISLDEKGDSTFSNPELDVGQARNMNVKTVPALLAIDLKNKQILPLAQGYAAEHELEKQALFLVELEQLRNQV